MGRHSREFQPVTSVATAALGATDTATVIDLVAPFIGAKVDQWSVTTKTAGTGTGTATFQLVEMTGVTSTVTSTAYTALSNNITIDADAVTGYYHGSALGNGTGAVATGNRLAVVSTKTGTVTTGVISLVNVLWLM